MMNRLWWIGLLLLCACGSSLSMLPEPLENQQLLIGSVILNLDGYQDKFMVITHDIEVAIIGRYRDQGAEKIFSRWVNTDAQGYFYIANVPDGEYAIKGFRVNLIDLGEIRIANELNDPARNYYELLVQEPISFHADLFDTLAHQRIIDMKYNVFTLFQNGIVDYERFARLRDLKLSTGDIFDQPPVPSYFMDQYPDSAWDSYLRVQL